MTIEERREKLNRKRAERLERESWSWRTKQLPARMVGDNTAKPKPVWNLDNLDSYETPVWQK